MASDVIANVFNANIIAMPNKDIPSKFGKVHIYYEHPTRGRKIKTTYAHILTWVFLLSQQFKYGVNNETPS